MFSPVASQQLPTTFVKLCIIIQYTTSIQVFAKDAQVVYTVAFNNNCHSIDYFDTYKTLIRWEPFDSRKYTEVQKYFSWHCSKGTSWHCVKCTSPLFCYCQFYCQVGKPKHYFVDFFLPSSAITFFLYVLCCVFLAGKISMSFDAYQ